MPKTYILILLVIFALTAFVLTLELVVLKDSKPEEDQTTQTNTNEQGDILTFQIAPYTQDCVGVAPMKCLVVNNELFYDNIQGFEYQQGTEYTIKVRRTKRENTPADASAYIYELVEIVEEG